MTDYERGVEYGRKEAKEYIRYLKRQRQGGIQKQYNKIKRIKELTEENERLKSQVEKMKCCQNCTHSTLNECDNLVCELNWFNLPEDYPCVNYSKWELEE